METAPLVGYVRVSTAAQAESGVGIAAQRRTLEDAAAAHGLDIGEVYADLGKSGKRMANRDGLSAALAAIASGAASGLVVAKIDRLGRNAAEVLELVDRAQREGWRLVALDAGLDTASPAGELVAGMLALAARFEWRRISERQVDKFAELRRQGRPRGRAAAAPELADELRAMREQGLSFAAIADALNERDEPTPRGGAEWRPSSVRSAIITRNAELAAQAPTTAEEATR